MRSLLIVNITCFLSACAMGTNIQAEEVLTENSDSKSSVEISKEKETNVPTKSNAKNKFAFQNILKRYIDSDGVISKVTKTVHLELLDEEKNSEGEIIFAKGRLRVEIAEPDPSLIIFNSQAIWIIVPENKELGSKTQVTKIISNKNQKRSRAPLAHLLTDNNAWDVFQLKSDNKTIDGFMESTLIPRNKDETPEVTSLKIKYDLKKSEINQIAYVDDIGNVTTFKFKNSNFKIITNKNLFIYKPKKNDEVTVFE
jgi:outer membrane lipoprotein carrier protein